MEARAIQRSVRQSARKMRLVIDQIQQYRPSVIVTWPRRLGKLDELVRSLPSLGYHLERSYDIGWRVYVRE